jgi:hypothetical protein
VGFSEASRNRNTIRTTFHAFFARGTCLCLDRKDTILVYGPSFHTITFIVTLKSEDIRNGNPFWTRKAITAISAETFSYLPHPIHQYANLFWG